MSKNISTKMLKDVGMTVPTSRETRAVYRSICSKTEDEGSIYAARQRMRAVYMQQDRGWGQYICSKTEDGGMQQ